MVSWWGMRGALNSQKQVYSFLNHIEHTFLAMSAQEQAFTAEEAITHSRQVLEKLTEVRKKILLTREKEDEKQQQEQLNRVLERLNDYENSFSNYVQQNLEMQTLRSRMQAESKRLRDRVANLVKQTSLAVSRDFEYRIMLALVLQQNYIANPKNEIRGEIETTITGARQQLVAMNTQQFSDNIKLQLYRISWAANSFAIVFNRFADQYEHLDFSHRNLRSSYQQLKNEFNQAITIKTRLINQYIKRLQTIIVATSGLAVLISIGAIILLSEFISRPIAELKRSALNIVNGDLNTSVTITTRDEIGELGDLFNQMTARLRTSFGELETYRDHLEKMVQDRTRELELEIVEHQEAEKNLATSEKRFRTIFDNSIDGILISDTTTRKCLLANRTICTMLGYSEEELLTFSVTDLHPPQDHNWIIQDFEEVLAQRKTLSKDIPILRKDGSVFQAEISATIMELGGQSLLLSCIRDITERKAAEEQRLKISKLESIGVLAGGIAHDFNNILAAILGYVSLIKTRTQENDKRYTFLEQLEKASIRARDLTQQLLTFSKGGEPVKKVTAVAEIIRESAEFVLRGSNVRCNFNFADNLWHAKVDAGQISQVIQNIIVNARHAMPNGGIITVSCRNVIPAPQTTELLAGKNCLEITIADNGPGIPEKLRQRIFDPYFTTKKEGSGLGLAITHSIINKHQGSISVNSPKEGGTTFIILLPAAPYEATVKEQPTIQASVEQLGKTVMVMDDEETLREITAEMLGHLGYTTIMAADGQEAIERYRQYLDSDTPINLVIMDLTIPGGMGGKEAAEKILAMDPNAILVVASGYSQDPIMANYKSYGFSGFLPKPFNLEELRTTLQKIDSSS